MKTPYEILGINETASLDELKAAYRKKSMQYHPDHNNGDDDYDEIMAEINDAYEFLKHHIGTRKTSVWDSMTVAERKEFMQRMWEREEAVRKFEYAQSGKKMRDKIARNLEPIREINKEFFNKIQKTQDYQSLFQIASDFSKSIEKMIIAMYEYTEKHHRYGVPKDFFESSRSNSNHHINTSIFLNKVRSSNIDSVGYDDENSTLYIKFTTQAIYVYFDVPQNVYQALLSAPSIGKYFATEIKNEYNYKKL